MPLEAYRRRRHFERTPEPEGRVGRTGGDGGLFVVQKHAAHTLHYDFRLELDGVLKSWAVPKGPSYVPSERRLAVHVEDHPLEYGDFEGVIPEGEYGAGTVMLWDYGRWTCLSVADEWYTNGHLKVFLDGFKLHGGWTLVRMERVAHGDKENWLLIKERDEFARRAGDPDVLEEDRSASSGRSMEEIAQERDRIWRSKGDILQADRIEGLAGARKAGLPVGTSLRPELATLVDRVPDGGRWLHEVKFDGYRLLCRVERGEVRLFTRNDKDWTDRFPDVAAAARQLAATSALLDGEVVALNEEGVSEFQKLQNALGESRPTIFYYAFDLLYLDGYDIRDVELLERKKLLRELLDRSEAPRIRFSDHVTGSGEAFLAQACEHGLEGVVSKRADSPYRGRRGKDWLKTKCRREQELVIVGYTEPSGSRVGLGALLLGYHEQGALRLAGKVGTGFDEATLLDLRKRLSRLERDSSPVSNPPRGAAARGVHWVTPELVAEIAFTEWTADGSLRHPSFKGLREDKPASEVVRERSASLPSEEAPKTPEKRRNRAQKGAERASGRRPASKSDRGSSADSRGRSRRRRGGKEASTEDGAWPEGLEGVRVRLTSPNKVLYADPGLTKRDLAVYYAAVSERMLPHMRDRPLTLVRCPEGSDEECFYQKHASGAVPKSVKRVQVRERTKSATYLYVDDVEGLVSLVQIGALEIHQWGSRRDRLERPDLVVFDLDPGPGVDWSVVSRAALETRERLKDLGLQSYVRTTGGKGLHVVSPLTRRRGWEDVKAFSRGIAEVMARDAPDRYTAVASKAERDGKIYVDYLRNARGASAIACYSTRARAGAPVATPIGWDELRRGVDPVKLNVATVPSRVRDREDPWASFFDVRQSITRAMESRLGLR